MLDVLSFGATFADAAGGGIAHFFVATLKRPTLHFPRDPKCIMS